MSILKSIKRKLLIRFQYLIKKHNLNDPIEQQKIIDQFVIMQKNKRAFGRKTQEIIRDKVRFMIHYKLIKVV